MTIFTLLSCDKKEARLTNVDTLVGTWNWVRTDGGIADNIHETPQSTGKTVKLRIAAENKYEVIENNVVIEEGTFTVELRKCIHDGDMKQALRFSNGQYRMVEDHSSVTLELSDESNDGVFITYVKANAH